MSTPRQLATDRDFARRTLLLHIAVTAPYDAAELSRRISRPQQAIHEDIETLMDEGVVHLYDAALRTSSAARIIAEASREELRDIHGQALADFASGGAARPAVLVALAESGCDDEALIHLLVRAASEHPDDAAVAGALSLVARVRGMSDAELRLMRATDAAARGSLDSVLSLTETLLADASPEIQARAALLAAGAHIQANRLDRAEALYRHVGPERIGIHGAWAVVAAVGRGGRAEAEAWRAAMGADGLTSLAAGLTDAADGLLRSLDGNGDGALDMLARSVSTLGPLGAGLTLPESPAALAALIAIGRGEPATAETLLERAMRADLGGGSAQARHVLLSSWCLMVQGRVDAAERRIEQIDPRALDDRDALLYWSLQAGLARRRTDLSAMRACWREIRSHTFGLRITLYDLLPLGEMMVVGARLRDSARVEHMVNDAMRILADLGDPVAWSALFHWHGVQAAFQAESPAALIPHANALAHGGAQSPYAATLATAGRTWLDVLRRETDFASVESSARALAKCGHVWDSARLAGQAALQHPDRESALSMMQLAREISKDHSWSAMSEQSTSLLTRRELEVGRLVLDGQGYRAIGEQLFISPKTVEHHVARMRSRLGASSRSELLEKLHDIVAEADE